MSIHLHQNMIHLNADRPWTSRLYRKRSRSSDISSLVKRRVTNNVRDIEFKQANKSTAGKSVGGKSVASGRSDRSAADIIVKPFLVRQSRQKRSSSVPSVKPGKKDASTLQEFLAALPQTDPSEWWDENLVKIAEEYFKARKKAREDEQRKKEEEAKAREDAKIKEVEIKRKAREEAKLKDIERAKQKADEDTKNKREEAAKREEAKRIADEEAEKKRKDDIARRARHEESRRKELNNKKKREADESSMRRAMQESRRKDLDELSKTDADDAEIRRKRGEARRKEIEDTRKRDAEEYARRREREEARRKELVSKQKRDEEAKRIEEEKRIAEATKRRLQEERENEEAKRRAKEEESKRKKREEFEVAEKKKIQEDVKKAKAKLGWGDRKSGKKRQEETERTKSKIVEKEEEERKRREEEEKGVGKERKTRQEEQLERAEKKSQEEIEKTKSKAVEKEEKERKRREEEKERMREIADSRQREVEERQRKQSETSSLQEIFRGKKTIYAQKHREMDIARLGLFSKLVEGARQWYSDYYQHYSTLTPSTPRYHVPGVNLYQPPFDPGRAQPIYMTVKRETFNSLPSPIKRFLKSFGIVKTDETRTMSLRNNGKDERSIVNNGKDGKSIVNNGKDGKSIVNNGKDGKSIVNNGKDGQSFGNYDKDGKWHCMYETGGFEAYLDELRASMKQSAYEESEEKQSVLEAMKLKYLFDSSDEFSDVQHRELSDINMKTMDDKELARHRNCTPQFCLLGGPGKPPRCRFEHGLVGVPKTSPGRLPNFEELVAGPSSFAAKAVSFGMGKMDNVDADSLDNDFETHRNANANNHSDMQSVG